MNRSPNMNRSSNKANHLGMSTIIIIILLLAFVVMMFGKSSKSQDPAKQVTQPIPTTMAAVTTKPSRQQSWFELRENYRRRYNERKIEEEYE